LQCWQFFVLIAQELFVGMEVCVEPINDELEVQPEENNNSFFEMCIWTFTS
jgi:hypothetical protein